MMDISICVCVFGGGGGGGGLTELDLSIHTQQDVVALDITMDDLVGVKELQRLQTLDGWVDAKKRYKDLNNLL